MEGKGISALKASRILKRCGTAACLVSRAGGYGSAVNFFRISLLTLSLCLSVLVSNTDAQVRIDPHAPQVSTLDQWPTWKEDPGFFLTPNRFSIAKELSTSALWLQMGFGKPVMLLGTVQAGLEGLAWSRLRILSSFRFPVETVDYFFGTFFTWKKDDIGWKLRLSHISSHDVDGKDTVKGGSSSHFSGEFVEVTRSVAVGGSTPDASSSLLWTIGLRGYFHQVSNSESWISVPACLTWQFAGAGRTPTSQAFGEVHHRYYAFISTGDGPVWPTGTVGLRMERIAHGLGEMDLQLYYQYGASWAGTDAGTRANMINLQMDIRGF